MVRRETGIITVGHRPRASTLCLPDVTAHNHISQAFPFCICILQAINTGGGMAWERGYSWMVQTPVAPGWQLLHDTYFVSRKLVHCYDE